MTRSAPGATTEERPVGEALALFGVSVASALVPLINIEVYLVGLAAVRDSTGVWFLATVAGLGQMVGKVVWYYVGANSLRWRWVARRVDTPKGRATLEKWQQRTHDRPVIGASLLFASAAGGFPPFAIVAVLAGQLRMNLVLFLVVGGVGRTLRFAAFLGGAGWLTELTAQMFG
jgi:membrane protein YqaA with SNARE-associated domain